MIEKRICSHCHGVNFKIEREQENAFITCSNCGEQEEFNLIEMLKKIS